MHCSVWIGRIGPVPLGWDRRGMEGQEWFRLEWYCGVRR